MSACKHGITGPCTLCVAEEPTIIEEIFKGLEDGTIEEEPDVFHFEGTVVHPKPEEKSDA